MTWTTPRVAVIPTNNRECLARAQDAILPQVDHLVIVQNAGERIVAPSTKVSVIEDLSGIKNISRWWNRGLDQAQRYAERLGAKTWDVAVLNDDVIVPPGWFDKLSETLRRANVAVTSFGEVYMPVLHTRPGPINLAHRPQGFAWMTAGEKGIRADENLVWWAGDDDIWVQAMKLGGAMVVPGKLTHLYPNGQMTGELHEQAAKDMAAFVEKHGFRPW